MRSKVAENAGLLALLGDMQAVAALPLRERPATLARVAPFSLPVIRVVAALAERFFSRQNGPSTLCVAAIC
ncbi:hypothetical protein [Streptomyces goshikiensis]|uniref:hypothetical protein n=1 Tax=Streptomyces goshikiensis TaxID=1942 RepID=UPI003651E460